MRENHEGDGGIVDNILRRLGNLEASVEGVRMEVRAIAARIPQLATATSVAEVKSEVRTILAIIPRLATKPDVSMELAKMENAIVKWTAGIMLMTATLTCIAVNLVN